MPDAPAHWIATIDADGTLLGFDKSGRGEGIAVPVDCDLAPGKYRWNAEGERWEPIPKMHPKALPKGDPDQLIAIALGFRAIGRTIELPVYTKRWLETFERYPDDYKAGED